MNLFVTFNMRLASSFASMALALGVAGHVLPNATFIAGEIAQISQCGVCLSLDPKLMHDPNV